VDEAILLSDRILLMTNGPSSRIGEMVDVTIPRPRSRETVIEHPHYYKIRNHVIHFLVRHASHAVGGRIVRRACRRRAGLGAILVTSRSGRRAGTTEEEAHG
jgi:hypothetical protein